ncbi:MAG: 4Fe-4S double cluster binding domain-containing protein [Clostridia bacterium]
MHEFVEKAAQHLGFGRIFFLPPTPLNDWQIAAQATRCGTHLEHDISSLYPRAQSVVLLVFPYAPYPQDSRIGAYYVASNAAYHAAKMLAAELCENGAYAELAQLPARALALHYNIGVVGKNGLLRLPPYGSRVTLYTLLTDIPPRTESLFAPHCHTGCSACADACPSHAITDRLHVAHCIRFSMDGALHPADIMRRQRWYIGCEACMFACPFNSHIPIAEPDANVLKAFDTKQLIMGNASAARKLVGRNMSANGKLTAEAIAFAARDGRFESEIRAAHSSPFEAVRRASEWAVINYFSNTPES